ncbi:MAG: type II secretion system protein GspC [Candidatus Binataceae bacterium]|jgi:type II secretion system protein C
MTFNISERYLFALNVLLAALIIPYFAARTVSQMIKLHYAANVVTQPLTNIAPGAVTDLTAPRPRAVYNIIRERDIFNLAPAPEVSAPVEKEDLNIKLLGTSHLTGGARDFAIVADESGNQQLYRLGETIPSVGRLVQIGKNRAIIEHNGHRVVIEIAKDALGESGDDDAGDSRPQLRPHGPRSRGPRSPFIRNPMIRPGRPAAKADGVRKVGPNQYAVERTTINSNMQDMSHLLTEVRALPVMQNGATNGFRLSEIQPGSLFQQIGLQDGDVLTSISGEQLTDPARALRMLSTLQTRSDVTLIVLRNGAPVRLSYSIH